MDAEVRNGEEGAPEGGREEVIPMNMQRTYIMIKPDAVQRGLIGEIVSRFEKTGMKLIAMKLMLMPKATAEKHYGEHKGKPFYDALISYITSGPVLAMVLEGEDVVAVCRNMMGKTNPKESALGTIRGDYGMQTGRNIIHGSDSAESAAREISVFFRPEELITYGRTIDQWTYE
jgi:nucleoside-diphosphate kinase